LKKLANFTPTHTTGREEVSNFYSQDASLAYFLNKLNKRFFCFHNVLDREYCRNVALKIKKNLKNVEFLLYKAESFNLVFTSHLLKLQEEGFTDIVYLPDDAACVTKNTKFIDEVLELYKKNKDITFLSLCIKSGEINHNAQKTHHISKNLILSLYPTSVFRDTNLLDIINRPYVAKINFLLELCDKTYSELRTKNEGDLYLRSQFLKQNLVKIACLNKRLFKCFYYNSTVRDTRLKELHLMRKLLQHKKHLV